MARVGLSMELNDEQEFYVCEIADVSWEIAWSDDETPWLDQIEVGFLSMGEPSRFVSSGYYARAMDEHGQVSVVYGPYATKFECLVDLGLEEERSEHSLLNLVEDCS